MLFKVIFLPVFQYRFKGQEQQLAAEAAELFRVVAQRHGRGGLRGYVEVLDRAAAKLRSDSRALTLECGGEIFRVPLYEIRYLDVEKNYTTVHAKRDYTVKKTLGALSDELDERFFRIGRAAIVNLSFIRRVTKTDAILSDGAAIPLPRGAYEALNRAIIAYH